MIVGVGWEKIVAGLGLIVIGIGANRAFGDWPMPGHDPQRTSRATEFTAPCTRPLWHVKLSALIPSRACIVTAQRRGNIPSTVYVTAADGIHALDPENGRERWFYRMKMPPGDAPSVVDHVVFVAGTDRTIHAVSALYGRRIWQTDRAGAPFYVNPLVVNGKVYAGSRDGFFYSFEASSGKLVWSHAVGERISYSAAYQVYPEYPKGLVFFAAENSCAYALDAENGSEVWSSCGLPGSTFTAFWPVVAEDRVLLVSSSSYPTSDEWDLNGLARDEVLLEEAELGQRVDQSGRLDLQHHVQWLEEHPQRQSLLVLDRRSGEQAEIAPILWWGNPGGQRYPPAIGHDGRVWITTSWLKSWFGSGRYAGWEMGTARVVTVPDLLEGLESADEPEAHSIIGLHIYHNDGGDGADKGGIESSTGGNVASWAIDTFHGAFGEYWGAWKDRKSGNNLMIKNPASRWENSVGWHGHQNPPVPLNGKVYFHRSNAVICMEQ